MALLSRPAFRDIWDMLGAMAPQGASRARSGGVRRVSWGFSPCKRLQRLWEALSRPMRGKGGNLGAMASQGASRGRPVGVELVP